MFAMAALRPCTSGLVVGASQLSFVGTSPPRIVRPFGGASVPNLKTSAGKTTTTADRHRRQARVVDGPSGDLDPDEKKRVIEEQVNMWREIFNETHKSEKDMPFQEDIEKIDEYMEKLTSWNTKIFDVESKLSLMFVCRIARKGVKLASKVMESDALRLDKMDNEIFFTYNKTLAMYVSIFVKIAEDIYNMKYSDETILSVLCASRGVAAVGHTLLQDALENVNHLSNYIALVQDADKCWCDYVKKMNNLEKKFKTVSRSSIADDEISLIDAMVETTYFVSELVAVHDMILGYVSAISKGTKLRASGDEEPGTSGTSSSSTSGN